MKIGSMLKQIAIDKLYKIEKIIATGALYILIVSGRKEANLQQQKSLFLTNLFFMEGSLL